MTAAFAPDQRYGNRAEQLESLRRASMQVGTRPADLLPEPESRLAIPQWLAEALAPEGRHCYAGERWRCCRELGHCCWAWLPR